MSSRSSIGIVGAGVVGTAMMGLFGPDAIAYDVRAGIEQDAEAINACQIAFVCVPTPSEEGGACDTSIVAETIEWLETPLIVIRSTIEPGTTVRLRESTGKRIVFQPEYLGETTDHPYADAANRPFLVLGGPLADASAVADFYKRYYNGSVRFHFCDATTAELAKYMENAFLAAKVTFVNEFHDIASAFGVDFNLLREVWLADERINPDHTQVYAHARGFAGKCLPKDVAAIIAASRQRGCPAELLEAVVKANDRFQGLRAPEA